MLTTFYKLVSSVFIFFHVARLVRATFFRGDTVQVQVYKFGSVYKLVRAFGGRGNDNNMPRDQDAADSLTEQYTRFQNNISRAKATVRELVMCNDWDYFVTLTLSKDKVNRKDKSVYDKITQWVRDMRKKYGCPFKYVFVRELHKDGAIHFHGVVSGIDPLVSVNEHGYPDVEEYRNRFGFCCLKPISNNSPRIASYISKYISKDGSDLEKGEHFFKASLGLGRRVQLPDAIIDDFEITSFYINDFCAVRWVDSYEELQKIVQTYKEQTY